MVTRIQTNIDPLTGLPRKKLRAIDLGLPSSLEGWGFDPRDVVRDTEGNIIDYVGISPQGQTYYKKDLEALLAGETPQVSTLATGKQRAGMLGEVPIAPPKLSPIDIQGLFSLDSSMRKLYPELFSSGQQSSEVFSTLVTQASQNTETFWDNLQKKGRSQETDTLLKSMGVDQPTIDKLYGGKLPAPGLDGIPTLFENALPLIMTPRTTDTMIRLFTGRPDVLRRNLITAGQNDNTVALVKALYPDITDRGISDYFSVRVPDNPETTGLRSSLIDISKSEGVKGWFYRNIELPLLDKYPRLADNPIVYGLGLIASSYVDTKPFQEMTQSEQVFTIIGDVAASIPWTQVLSRTGIGVIRGAVTESAASLYDNTLGKNLDAMIAKRGRGLPPSQFNTFQNWVYDQFVKDRADIIQRATDNMLTRLGKSPNVSVEQVIKDSAEATVSDFENRLPSNEVAWARMSEVDRTKLVVDVGLDKSVALKNWGELTLDEKNTVNGVMITPSPTPSIPSPTKRYRCKWSS